MPDVLFGIDDLDVNDATVSGTMPTGPWLRGPDGMLSVGALGVLIDNVLGYRVLESCADDRWSVSTEITVEVSSGLQSPGARLSAEAESACVDEVGGLAVGRVLSEAGDVVATCSQRGRFLPLSRAALDPPELMAHPGRGSLAELFDLQLTPAAGRVKVQCSPLTQNPMRNLHGGVSLCVAEMAATLALTTRFGPALSTASIHVTYLRPIPAGSSLTTSARVIHRGRSFGVVDVTGYVDGRTAIAARVVANPAP